MNTTIFLLMASLLVFCPTRSLAQNSNSWGSAFDCGVDWFDQCKAVRENQADEPNKRPAGSSGTSTANLPLPVRNVLENPSSETAKAYVLWSRQAREKLAKASEYIAQATREIYSEASIFRNSNEATNDLALTGVGPVGLYYFFSPGDQSAAKDVAVLNKIWREGRIGVVGIPVRGNDEEVVKFVNEVRPLFPIRKSEGDVRFVKPIETPELYLALPLEKKLYRMGSTITSSAITEAIEQHFGGTFKGKSSLDNR